MREFGYLIFIAILTFSSSALAEYVLFQEDFSDGVADGFVSDCSIWEVSPEGTYHIENTGYEVFCWSFAGETWWDDYGYSLSIKSEGSINQMCAFRAQDNGDCYLINVRATPWNDVWLYKVIDGIINPIFSTELSNTGGVWHDFNVTAIGPTINFAFDGQDIFTYSDSVDPFMYGKIGVVSYTGGVIQQQTLDIDDILVDYLIVPTARTTWSKLKAFYR